MLLPSVRASAMMASANEIGSMAQQVRRRSDYAVRCMQKMELDNDGRGGKNGVLRGSGYALWDGRLCVCSNVWRCLKII